MAPSYGFKDVALDMSTPFRYRLDIGAFLQQLPNCHRMALVNVLAEEFWRARFRQRNHGKKLWMHYSLKEFKEQIMNLRKAVLEIFIPQQKIQECAPSAHDNLILV
ncbi:Fc.00g027390.m01.CDS01 [Cosmosporella sp. VM-42]